MFWRGDCGAGLSANFYGQLKPISEHWIPEALKISGFSRKETLGFDDPKSVMENFKRWLAHEAGDRCVFISDNNGFDCEKTI